MALRVYKLLWATFEASSEQSIFKELEDKGYFETKEPAQINLSSSKSSSSSSSSSSSYSPRLMGAPPPGRKNTSSPPSVLSISLQNTGLG